MEYDEYINCYCFNPACVESIFNARIYSVVKMPISKVLAEESCCPACGGELISKPILEIKLLICNCHIPADAAVI